jgi:hypothetical protein
VFQPCLFCGFVWTAYWGIASGPESYWCSYLGCAFEHPLCGAIGARESVEGWLEGKDQMLDQVLGVDKLRHELMLDKKT